MSVVHSRRHDRGGNDIRRTARPGRGRRGFTLIELSIAISILMIGMVSVLSATSRMHSLRKQNRERAMAQNATRSVAERIHSRAYELSADPGTWAEEMIAVFSPGGEFGDTFDVRGLSGVSDRPADGTITILTDETATDQEIGFRIGLPRDLNGDGDADDPDVSADARVLPVLLEVQWRSQSGTSSYRHAMYVLGY
ncbi:MAG: prepilin-type N-terminal cleavage/methylation domain-containing protein [Planctomycetota bacterium]